MYFSEVSSFVFIAIVGLASSCHERKDLTAYARRLVVASRPIEPEPLRLPRRLMGDVFLNRGYVTGLEGVELVEEDPVTVVCFNETLGAIQPKLRASNVSVTYDWVYGDNESWGRATLPGQDIYIDLDIERDEKVSTPQIIALYVSEPVHNEFDVRVLGGKAHADADPYILQVLHVTKIAFQRDIRLALTYDFGPRIEEFLTSESFTVSK